MVSIIFFIQSHFCVTLKSISILSRSAAALRYFPSTLGQERLKIENAENFKENRGTLGCEETRSWFENSNFQQREKFLKILSNTMS